MDTNSKKLAGLRLSMYKLITKFNKDELFLYGFILGNYNNARSVFTAVETDGKASSYREIDDITAKRIEKTTFDFLDESTLRKLWNNTIVDLELNARDFDEIIVEFAGKNILP